jgi:hypothetical protein
VGKTKAVKVSIVVVFKGVFGSLRVVAPMRRFDSDPRLSPQSDKVVSWWAKMPSGKRDGPQ